LAWYQSFLSKGFFVATTCLQFCATLRSDFPLFPCSPFFPTHDHIFPHLGVFEALASMLFGFFFSKTGFETMRRSSSDSVLAPGSSGFSSFPVKSYLLELISIAATRIESL